jgi:hypothetical protein
MNDLPTTRAHCPMCGKDRDFLLVKEEPEPPHEPYIDVTCPVCYWILETRLVPPEPPHERA